MSGNGLHNHEGVYNYLVAEESSVSIHACLLVKPRDRAKEAQGLWPRPVIGVVSLILKNMC